MLEWIKKRIKSNSTIKRIVLNFVVHPVKARPRFWVRLFMPLYIKRGRGSVIYRSVRRDIVPFNRFTLGSFSVIEDFSTINNAVGDLIIGSRTRVGLGNTIIGPVSIGDDVQIAQNVILSGLNHNYSDVKRTIEEQGVITSPINIADDVWIGANSVITMGVSIGKHSVIAAASVVTANVPSYSVVAGIPAKVIKRYDFTVGKWIKV